MREEVFWLGRLLFSLVLFDNGYRHLVANTEGSTQYAAYKGVPNAKVMVQVTGVFMLLGGLATSSDPDGVRPHPGSEHSTQRKRCLDGV